MVATEAGALAVFDFDDFPAAGIPTADYGCDGKIFCTADDVEDARQAGITSISKRDAGVTATITRPATPLGVGIIPESGGPGDDNVLDPGNIEFLGGDLDPYVGDFSKNLLFAEVSVGRVIPLPGVMGQAEFGFLEAWSEPGATGTLLGRTTQPVPGADLVLLSLSASPAAPFRSIRFGLGLAGCEAGCEDDSIEDQQGFADDIAVQPVPEPSAALLFAVGALITRSAIRRRAF
jgi:hypothetical protein